MDRREIGRRGEQHAAAQLQARGYDILAMNYHSRYGEIDIIAQSDTYILFCEVKTRAKNALGTPAQAVTAAKQKKLIKTAFDYLIKEPNPRQPRFDVIEVVTDTTGDFSRVELRVIENAFSVENVYEIF